MEFGNVVVDSKESEVVRYIFQQYLIGHSFKVLADDLQQQPIRYEAQKSWNKNMVARILQDGRYAGDKGFPQIIPRESLNAAMEKRSAQRLSVHRTAEEKAFRQLSGHPATAKMMAQTIEILNSIAGSPGLLVEPPPPNQIDAVTLGRELEQSLAQMPIDEDRANVLIHEYAVAQYQAIGSGGYETERLRQIFADRSSMEIMDADLLRSTVSKIQVKGGNVKSICLKNMQVIGGAH
jgi:hypothetical protein